MALFKKKPDESLADKKKFRDVYEAQQFERSSIGKKNTMFSRTIFSIIISLLIASLVFVIISVISYGVNIMSGSLKGLYNKNVKGQTEVMQNVETYITDDGRMIYKGADEKYYESEEMARESFGGKSTSIKDLTPGSVLKKAVKVTPFTVGLSSVAGLITFAVAQSVLTKNLKAQNALEDVSDINQHDNDIHIALPEEIMEKFDIFPDLGAHSNVTFSSMISHAMLSNKGLGTFNLTRRYKKDTFDEKQGRIIFKGEPYRDGNGDLIYDVLPVIDEKMGDKLFDASGMTNPSYRTKYDAGKLSYNPGNKDRDKLQDKKNEYKTIADVINRDWFLPDYEFQRPAGMYIVDTAPVNTMVRNWPAPAV